MVSAIGYFSFSRELVVLRLVLTRCQVGSGFQTPTNRPSSQVSPQQLASAGQKAASFRRRKSPTASQGALIHLGMAIHASIDRPFWVTFSREKRVHDFQLRTDSTDLWWENRKPMKTRHLSNQPKTWDSKAFRGPNPQNFPLNGWKDSWSFETSFLTQTLCFAFVESVLWFYHAKQKFKNNKNPGPIRSNVPPNPPPGLLLGIFFPPFTGNDTVRERPSPWTRAGGVKNSKWNSPSFTDVFQKTKRELTTKKQVDDWTLSTRKSRSWKFGCARGTLVFQDSCGYVPKRHLPFW